MSSPPIYIVNNIRQGIALWISNNDCSVRQNRCEWILSQLINL